VIVAPGRENVSAESVALVQWPRDAERRARLASAKVPCLLLVAPDTEPPVVELWEDWIRLPSDERDVSLRVHGLARRVCRPEIVDDSVLRNSYGAVMLPAAESTIVRALLDSDAALVPREHLEHLVWPDGPPTTRALDDLVRCGFDDRSRVANSHGVTSPREERQVVRHVSKDHSL